MPIEFECQACGSSLKVPDEKAGATGKCPQCQAVIEIPIPEAEEAESTDDDWMNEGLADYDPSAGLPPTKAARAVGTPGGGSSDYVYTPKTGLVWAITILMSLFILATLAGAAASFYQLGLLKQLEAGQDVPMEQLEMSDMLVAGPACTYVLILLVLGITWCFWKAGCNRNARAISGKELEYTPGWCAGCYFVPFANLVWPYNAMKEIWEATKPGISLTLVGWWWGLWIFNNIVSNVTSRFSLRAEEIDELILATNMELAIVPLDLVSSVVALMMVRKLHRLQQEAAGQA